MGLLALAAVPLGVVGGPFAALLAIAFAVIALRSHAWGRWRTTALVGIAISILVLLVFAAEVTFVVFFE